MNREATKSIVVGALLGVLFASSAMYAGQKTAVIDGGNIPAALLGFGVLTAILGRRASKDAGNLAQTTSSSAAMMAISGGLIGPVAAMALEGGQAPSLLLVVAWGVAVGIVGTLLAVPLRAAFIKDDGLPFPSGVATAEVIEDVYRVAGSASSRLWVLAIGGVFAFLLGFVRSRLGWIPEIYVPPIVIGGITAEAIGLGIGCSPLLVAIGYLSGPRTGLSLVIGSTIAWAVIAPRLVAAGIAEADYFSLLNWQLFVGTGLMLGGSLVSVVGSYRSLRAGLRRMSSTGGFSVTRGHALALGVSSLAVVVLGTVTFDVSPFIPLLALVLSGALAAAAAHAMGETDNTPAGPLGGFAQLVIGGVAPGGVAGPLSGGGVVNGTLMHASLTLQNWKTGSRIGTSPGTQLIAQLVGVVVGAITCAAVFMLVEAAYGLGTPAMPAPAAQSWKVTATLAQHGVSAIPEGALIGTAIAFVVGVVFSLQRIAKYTPSPVAMGLAFILPPYISLTIAIGGLAYWLTARRSKPIADGHGVVLASGLIGGEAIAGLLIAALLLRG